MKKEIVIVISFLMLAAKPAGAIPALEWSVDALGGGYWQYNYTVTNDLIGLSIDSFSVDYTYYLYQLLEVKSVPAKWETSVFDPDLNLSNPTAGQFWAFADPGFAIAPGTSQSVFAVSFLWGIDEAAPPLQSTAGLRADGDQAFNYYTIATNPVPEPGTLLLLGTGFIGTICISGFAQRFLRR